MGIDYINDEATTVIDLTHLMNAKINQLLRSADLEFKQGRA
jgi:hypothetical protein